MSQVVSKEQFLNAREERSSPWLLIDQNRIDTFAAATNDFQFIHTQPERAAQSAMGSTIAHGFLTLSLISHLSASLFQLPPGVTMVYNYGLNKLRFLAPVKVNRRIRGRFQTMDVAEKRPGAYRVQMLVTIDIEDEEKPALVAEWVVMIFTDEGHSKGQNIKEEEG